MKITKTQLKEIIKEELEAVMSEEDIGEGIFDMFKKKKKDRRGLDQRLQDQWDELSYTEQQAALKRRPGVKVAMPYGHIPADVRDEYEENQHVRDMEKRNARIRAAREEEEAQKRGYRADADRDFEEREKAKRKRGRYTGGSLDGEGSPSAPWDE